MKTEHRQKCATKKGREAMALAVHNLANKHGWCCNSTTREHEITLTLSRNDYRITMHFDGSSRVGAYLGIWFTEIASDRKPYSSLFGVAIHGSVNEYHHAKATTCTETFDG